MEQDVCSSIRVLAAGTDALFFYVPIIHDEKLCVGSDKKLKIAALVMRCFSDIFYIIDIYYQIFYKINIYYQTRN